MGKEFYTCEYCFIKYRPSRRRVQKFCCNKCKSKAYHAKNRKPLPSLVEKGNTSKDKTKIDEMSLAGVANSATATLIVNLLMKALTKEENKVVTKSVLKKELSNWIGRYHKINGLPPKSNGAEAHFDMETKKIVYLGENNANKENDSLIA